MSAHEIEPRHESQSPKEIERKYLIPSLPENIDQFPFSELRQGYVLISTEGVLRIREEQLPSGKKVFYQTVKVGKGLERIEIEIRLEEQAFQQLWLLTEGRQVEKRRYHIPLDEFHMAAVDVYNGTLHGLITAEVEFETIAQSELFVPSEWFGKEVTDDDRYANVQLALHGLPPTRESVQSPKIVISKELQKGVVELFALVDQRLALLPADVPLFLFTAGRTSAGKTSAVTEQILQKYGKENQLVISTDDYFGGDTRMAHLKATTVPDINWDHPEYLNFPLLVEHLRTLQAGGTIEKPSFSFKTSEPTPETTQLSSQGKKIINVEGIHALNEKLAEFDGLHVFVDITLHGSIIRRLMRDVTRTPLNPAQILRYYLNTVEPMYREYVAPTKARADIILKNEYDPITEAQNSGRYEHQVKYLTTVKPEQIQKHGDHIASVYQEDFYFMLNEGTMNDELLRIRHENGHYFMTYKGPRQKEGSTIYRPKFEFQLDEPTAKLLIEKEKYSRQLKKVTKQREIFQLDGVVVSHDTVEIDNQEIGTFIEIRGDGDEMEEQLLQVTGTLNITSDPIATPYALMEAYA